MSDPVAEFERRFAEKIGTEYAIAVNSGTSALHAALEAVDVRGGEVIMPALCPAMVAFAIIHAGAQPIFADVHPETFLVTPTTISPLIGNNTRAIIPVSLYGLPADTDALKDLALPIIEDCAQCLFGRYKDTFAGPKADMACYSFEAKKHMTTGSEGGMIITNNAALAERARKFSGLGYAHLSAGMGGTRTSLNIPEAQSPDYLRFDTIGLNYRMSFAQAEKGIYALKYVQERIQLRQEIGYLWQHVLGSELQKHSYDADHTFWTAAWPGPIPEWRDFYDGFVKRGGDGFYAAPQLPWNEPALSDFKPLNATPVAERLQRSLMLFKTNYRSLYYAMQQTKILQEMLHVPA
jgi:perosamine synthetase